MLRTQGGTPLSRHNVARTIREAADAAGVGHVTPRIMRRSLGTIMSEANIAVGPSAASMGHSNEVNQAECVQARRDRLEREQVRDRLASTKDARKRLSRRRARSRANASERSIRLTCAVEDSSDVPVSRARSNAGTPAASMFDASVCGSARS